MMKLPKVVVSPWFTPSQLHLAMQIMKWENQGTHPGVNIVTGKMGIPVCQSGCSSSGSAIPPTSPIAVLTASQSTCSLKSLSVSQCAYIPDTITWKQIRVIYEWVQGRARYEAWQGKPRAQAKKCHTTSLDFILRGRRSYSGILTVNFTLKRGQI